MVRRFLLIGTVVMALLAPTAALAGERGESNAGGDRGNAPQQETDRGTRSTDGASERADDRQRDVDRTTDRAPQRKTDRRCDRVIDRATDCTQDEVRRCDRVTDRLTDCTRNHDGDDARPTVRQVLKRCLWHHVGDRPIWEGLSPRELRHLLHRCLLHHTHAAPPV